MDTRPKFGEWVTAACTVREIIDDSMGTNVVVLFDERADNGGEKKATVPLWALKSDRRPKPGDRGVVPGRVIETHETDTGIDVTVEFVPMSGEPSETHFTIAALTPVA